MSAPTTLVSACVATYRRPGLLDRLLAGLQAQALPPGVALEVVLVDNDATASAEAVARRWQAAGLDLRYETQPEPNISLTRNRTVAEARGDWLAFVDDDEVPAPDWLAQLLAAAEAHRADVVFG